MEKYIFEEGMSEISRFGGGYEQTCRDMLKSGLDYWDEHPKLDPKYHGYKGVYGILGEDNEDSKALRDVVIAGTDCTGAMFQAVITSILWIRKFGWDEYVKMMKEARKNE